jgi:ABC-type uncharacterized transport system involved in gliding motility auxiliary subunit
LAWEAVPTGSLDLDYSRVPCRIRHPAWKVVDPNALSRAIDHSIGA